MFFGTSSLSYNIGSSTWMTSSTNVPFSAAQFVAGEQIYIWIYNKVSLDSMTEWGLFTRSGSTDAQNPDWLIPTGPEMQQSFPILTFLSDENQATYGGTPLASGPGIFTPPTSTFHYQTHRFVPEPASNLALALMGFYCLSRRQRRAEVSKFHYQKKNWQGR
jgi:hypothetical protein